MAHLLLKNVLIRLWKFSATFAAIEESRAEILGKRLGTVQLNVEIANYRFDGWSERPSINSHSLLGHLVTSQEAWPPIICHADWHVFEQSIGLLCCAILRFSSLGHSIYVEANQK
jgi:hypothetical protein